MQPTRTKFSPWLQVLFIIMGIIILAILREVVLTAFFAVVLAVVFSFPVNWFAKLIPRGAAVLLTLLIFCLVMGTLVYTMSGPVSEQWVQLQEKLPDAAARTNAWVHRRQKDLFQVKNPDKAEKAAPLVPAAAPLQPKDGWLEKVLAQAGIAISKVLRIVSFAVLVLVLSMFFVHEPKSYRDGLRSLVPKEFNSDFDELWQRLETGLRHWVGGIAVSMTLMGAFTLVALKLAGIQNWLLLGILTFFGTFIPYAGAILSAVPGLLMALTQSNEKFIAAMIVYLTVHLLEGYIVQPIIMKRAVTVRPAVLLIWQLVMGILAGPLGVIVATPLFVCVKIIVGYLYMEKKLGKVASSA